MCTQPSKVPGAADVIFVRAGGCEPYFAAEVTNVRGLLRRSARLLAAAVRGAEIRDV